MFFYFQKKQNYASWITKRISAKFFFEDDMFLVWKQLTNTWGTSFQGTKFLFQLSVEMRLKNRLPPPPLCF
jgi:phage anti-repressor protein